MALSFLSLRRVWGYLTPWWKSEERWFAWITFVLLLGLSIFSVYLAVWMNQWNKDFYNTIEKKDLEAFLKQLGIFVPLVTIMLAEFCTRQYVTNWMCFRWRRWLTVQMQEAWLSSKGYYKAPLKTHELDNPDQRIAQDARFVTYGMLSLVLVFFKEGINFVTFSIILWGLSQNLPLILGKQQWMIPGFLLWAAFAYSLLGIWIVFKVGRPLIALDREQERREADFRYRLVRLMERRDEIATFEGEFIEAQTLGQAFQSITQNYYQILKRNIYINLFQNFYINTGHFIPVFIAGPTYFAGFITLGVLMQIRGIFGEVYDSSSLIVFKFQEIASIIASVQRILTFYGLLEEAQRQPQLPTTGSHLKVNSLQLLKPSGELIWDVPRFELKPGEQKLFMAPSGRGKTTLLRVLKGIYPYYQGDVLLPNNIFFVPQRPYMPLGTLRQGLTYPSSPETFTDTQIISCLKDCLLEHLIPMLDKQADFHQMLSLGEQQRVNFVRILLHQPHWLVLDEPTSQLNEAYRDTLLKLLKQKLPKAGMLIITHQPLTLFPDIIHADGAPSPC